MATRDQKIRVILGSLSGKQREAAMMSLLRKGPAHINEMFSWKLSLLTRLANERRRKVA
jgi:hypothetical protein